MTPTSLHARATTASTKPPGGTCGPRPVGRCCPGWAPRGSRPLSRKTAPASRALSTCSPTRSPSTSWTAWVSARWFASPPGRIPSRRWRPSAAARSRPGGPSGSLGGNRAEALVRAQAHAHLHSVLLRGLVAPLAEGLEERLVQDLARGLDDARIGDAARLGDDELGGDGALEPHPAGGRGIDGRLAGDPVGSADAGTVLHQVAGPHPASRAQGVRDP